MKRVFCVQSISDIITNSSSEVFVLYDDNALKNIKDLVNAVLAAADTKLTFDELFEIQPLLDESEFLMDYPDLNGFPKDQLLQEAIEKDKKGLWDGRQYVYGYEVIAKEQKNQKYAEILSRIDSIFQTFAVYC